ncbi:UDP-N-acetylmuramoyl-L-alanyl-D-glutamate--2,6-diaminopimelate ligase [Candidatus Microgenomates bacterium]|nr:UDP-N-acetylmuramoyl-L-alanyl-D-glutamate--2,6-diaminopimelate ligase [Candidatus Microgenomates bacterium]
MNLYGRWRNFQHLLTAVWQVIKNGYPARDLTVIGVTGTDGKTTTTHLIGHILSIAGYKTAVISTLGAFLDGEEIDTGLHVTTPDPRVMQSILAQARQRGVTHVVIETTSHGLDQHRVLGGNFKIGVVTNITHEHLDYHKTFERYREAKAKLLRGVKVAVLNQDDPSFDYLQQKASSDAKIISYGSYDVSKHAMIVYKSVNLTPGGMEFEVKAEGKSMNFQTKLIGEYNAANILAAAGAVRSLNVAWDKIREAVSSFAGLRGRMEVINEGKKFTVVVDFAHTPGSLENLLTALGKIKPPKSKLIVAFGCPGQRDLGKRPLMGKAAAKLADFIILTADDPRTEDVERIIDDITRGIRQEAQVWDGQTNWRKGGKWVVKVPERGEAIALAIQKLAAPGDIVALCGKGHERSMAIDNMEYPWSDQEAARVSLKGGVKRMGDKISNF